MGVFVDAVNLVKLGMSLMNYQMSVGFGVAGKFVRLKEIETVACTKPDVSMMVGNHLAGLSDSIFALKEVAEAITSIAVGLCHVHGAIEDTDPYPSPGIAEDVADFSF